ncbi:hypothetical protein SLEP1_g11101 [Rubroshorea leprosula]|uniref:Uncharacterized protein n=1 Tax=Rubroshorea leprosula TaxID=152421 RepID=A0AAV5IA75_9ROSI|nr:hypothetical protein SLEP1_g11101 [Rubroshorea leprosula]
MRKELITCASRVSYLVAPLIAKCSSRFLQPWLQPASRASDRFSAGCPAFISPTHQSDGIIVRVLCFAVGLSAKVESSVLSRRRVHLPPPAHQPASPHKPASIRHYIL